MLVHMRKDDCDSWCGLRDAINDADPRTVEETDVARVSCFYCLAGMIAFGQEAHHRQKNLTSDELRENGLI